MKQLSLTFDVNKLISTIMYRKPHPLPFVKLRSTLGVFFTTKSPDPLGSAPFPAVLTGHSTKGGTMGVNLREELSQLGMNQDEQEQLVSLLKELEKALKSDEEVQADMDFIRDGYHAEIDRLRKIAYHSDELLMEYQQFLVQQTGVSNIKLKYVMNQ